MSVISNRTENIVYTGDVTGTENLAAATNNNSPGMIQIVTLLIGANTITVPTFGTVPTACRIFPPAGNTTAITLKGVAGDTGIRINNTDYATISLDPSVVSFVLNAAAQVTGVRLYWS